MMVVSLNRFESMLCISVLIILNVVKVVRILPKNFYIRIRRGFKAFQIMVGHCINLVDGRIGYRP